MKNEDVANKSDVGLGAVRHVTRICLAKREKKLFRVQLSYK